MPKSAPKPRKSLIEEIRQASARVYAQRAAGSFGDPSGLSEAERRMTYEQGWLDCLNALLGMAPPDASPAPAARPTRPN